MTRRSWIRLVPAALSLMVTASTFAADLVSESGKDLYQRFCASCHGERGRGDGPVSGYFRQEVPDLSLIARRHGGTYPRELVERIIDGRHVLAAHGTRIMPIWGQDLNLEQVGDPKAESATRIVITRLADYVWLLQRPDPSQQPEQSDATR